jgi:hypothetical protein
MDKLSVLLNRHNQSKTNKSKGFFKYNLIPATEKWAEYSIDVYNLKKLLQGAEFKDKFTILQALKVAEAKVEYMYKHSNFEINEATKLYKKLKRYQ